MASLPESALLEIGDRLQEPAAGANPKAHARCCSQVYSGSRIPDVSKLVALILACAALGLAAPRMARAQETNLRARLNAAKKACVVGDYKAGADVLGDLYVETNDPTILYNQARCYEQNNQNRQAIDRFREYLRKATITAEIRTEVEGHIAECKARLKEDDSAPPRPEPVAPPAPAPSPPPVPPPAPAADSIAATPAGLNLSEATAPEKEPESPLYTKWWFWGAVGGLVAAGTVTAILLAGGSKGACDGEKSVCLGVK